ncbi:hypothetical protein F66182_2753 [Fusarium sp. NRRL 66182]|nr:hypothetical protein F66182_2753 [Fusarium sp. NRRL 66182]
MATIKQIDGRTVHQIQSGQVIVDLCSVVKELVENSVDAGSTSIGLDLIEVADNGSGIAPANYHSVALKHHTSKLSSYSDIATLETFGFRGEALASLCALSIVSITTCQPGEAPKGTKLSFEPSGTLKGTTIVAASKGTTVSVERLFHNLPVRRRELERNIKREWNKVISLLNQYACIQTNLKFSVSQQPTKGKRIHLFSTKGNPTTRENIINIFGAKTMTVLVPLDLSFEMQPSASGPSLQIDRRHETASKEVRIVGHVSRPSHGDGRQTPDRQMFFVNGRPCGLPQFAKAFNEVYKSYNNSQSPFIFADIQLDTYMYDVNVSPDKRSILLHDQNDLLDNLRASLTNLFDSQDYSVPTSQLMPFKSRTEKQANTPFKPPSIAPAKPRDNSHDDDKSDDEISDEDIIVSKIPSGAARRIGGSRSLSKDTSGQNLISGWVERRVASQPGGQGNRIATPSRSSARPNSLAQSAMQEEPSLFIRSPSPASESDENDTEKPLPVRDFNKQLKAKSIAKDIPTAAESNTPVLVQSEPQIPAMKPLRRGQEDRAQASPLNPPRTTPTPQVATIIIGDEMVQGAASASGDEDEDMAPPSEDDMDIDGPKPSFGSRLTQAYAAGSTTIDGKDSFRKESDEMAENAQTLPDSDDVNADADAINERDRDDEMIGPSPETKRQEERELPSVSPESPRAFTLSEATTAEHENQPPRASIRKKEPTAQLLQYLRTNERLVKSGMAHWANGLVPSQGHMSGDDDDDDEITDLAAENAEAKLSLTISRKDFLKMRIAGQFNMGFIIASRPANTTPGEELEVAEKDELFIIDQHATDEKYNFERLQEIQTVQSQRLVHPKRLALTALEEEIVLQNIPAIEANGFKIHVDMSGDEPVGSRCEVLALPMSREVTFSLTDFEELIALLGEESSESKHIPRPSKVRKMFASRACRSSVMIGKALTHGQMETLVRHMAELDKPWNCPHGRPTMRHLCQLDSWDTKGWRGDGLQGSSIRWQSYIDGT